MVLQIANKESQENCILCQCSWRNIWTVVFLFCMCVQVPILLNSLGLRGTQTPNCQPGYVPWQSQPVMDIEDKIEGSGEAKNGEPLK